ncbi:hypothetical protein F8568_045165 [Actinomadura sp. LD22]|uniref:Uncharacterized protein n=1 Tax=Actinomadura physcomitrii TaxID=2650748 RepID=A0A6I4MQV4_9ACTN|nr:DUF5372 family protein [Actinomadura physcomitrii]MWA07400.1 hypothetical protein [Actinomadura physcomitrii]
MVTHPFHPWHGRRLRVLYSRRRWSGEGVEYVCEVEDARRVAIRQEWTDRGPEPAAERLSAESLTALRNVIEVLGSRCDGAGEAE